MADEKQYVEPDMIPGWNAQRDANFRNPESPTARDLVQHAIQAALQKARQRHTGRASQDGLRSLRRPERFGTK